MKRFYLFMLYSLGTSSILAGEHCTRDNPLRSQLTRQHAPVIIAYRDDGNGKGAVYDHYTIQHITNHPTEFSVPKKLDISCFETYLNGQPYNLPHGSTNKQDKQIPPICKKSYEGGLLILPGRRDAQLSVDENPSYKYRKPHEQCALKEARLRGQPVLAICAGSWELWESFGGTTIDVQHHQHLPMLTLNTDGTISNNVQVHDISIEEESILAKAMGSYTSKISVNSIHGKAVDERYPPNQLIITARTIANLIHEGAEISEQDDALPPNVSEPHTVEAFETKHGTPMLGLQYHSEGYYTTTPTETDRRHMNIIRYMAKAGDAYQAKRRMLLQLSSAFVLN